MTYYLCFKLFVYHLLPGQLEAIAGGNIISLCYIKVCNQIDVGFYLVMEEYAAQTAALVNFSTFKIK